MPSRAPNPTNRDINNGKKPLLHRGFTWSVRADAEATETTHLLERTHTQDEEEHADEDGLYPPHACWTADDPNPPNPYKHLPVYETIHRIRREIINGIDDPYSLDQLKSPRMNISVVRPLVDQFYAMDDISVIYALLVNRCQFIREQSYATHHQTVNLTRALLCELVAEKVLRRYNENNPGPKGLLKLATILVWGFEPFQNAPEEILQENGPAMHWTQGGTKVARTEAKLTALEVAIVSESKSFLASSACQKVVDAIYRGKLVYTPTSFIDILPDHWKKRPISLYDPRRGPILNQYRLIVPRTRNMIEVGQFLVLIVLYFVVMIGRDAKDMTAYTWWELVFDIYTTGWALDQFASILEHGWKVYSQNLWSFLDVGFITLFFTYLVLRLHAFTITDEHDAYLSARSALDTLSVAAPILIPRLAFNVMSENMLFVSLRAMMSDFLTLTLLAFWSFAGFLLSMKWLHNGVHGTYTIGKWMIWIWFGLDGTGITASADFHWFLGPALMIAFAFLGNTLFLTILVSMLSNTFSVIVSNAVPEIQYRRAVLTFEGVKSDALFAYMPPLNILALITLLPVKLITTPRKFHTINATVSKVVNIPLLLFLSWYERRTLWVVDRARRHGRPKSINWKGLDGPRVAGIGWWGRTMSLWDLSRFSVHGDLQAVFDHQPPQSVLDKITEGDEDDEENIHPDAAGGAGGMGKALFDELNRQFPDIQNAKKRRGSSTQPPMVRRRRRSTKPKRSHLRESESVDDALAKEFASSGDESEDSDGHKKRPHKLTRAERKDSIIDYSGNPTSDVVMQEASARLHKLEESTRRIEQMLVQIMEQAGGDGEDAGDDAEGGDHMDRDNGERELNREIQSGILE